MARLSPVGDSADAAQENVDDQQESQSASAESPSGGPSNANRSEANNATGTGGAGQTETPSPVPDCTGDGLNFNEASNATANGGAGQTETQSPGTDDFGQPKPNFLSLSPDTGARYRRGQSSGLVLRGALPSQHAAAYGDTDRQAELDAIAEWAANDDIWSPEAWEAA